MCITATFHTKQSTTVYITAVNLLMCRTATFHNNQSTTVYITKIYLLMCRTATFHKKTIDKYLCQFRLFTNV